jgi:hypothetical protein
VGAPMSQIIELLVWAGLIAFAVEAILGMVKGIFS